jgi:N6-L-threonylcarbamoyladenine synthase
MKILSIETSCDETAISVLECEFIGEKPNEKPVFKILGNALHSQIETHADFGGVFPTLAKREHIKNFTPILISALKSAGMIIEKSEDADQSKELVDDALSSLSDREQELRDQLQDFFSKYEKPDIDAIAITTGPGLEPALWVGITGAKILSFIWQIPIIPVNHMEGHITSVLINEEKSNNDQGRFEKGLEEGSKINFPAVALLISGGHTELVQVNSWGDYKLLGQTRDDAVGEAFDKVARIIGLKYPGGPKISALAKRWRDGEFALQNNSASIPWDLPRPMITKKDCDFSFSGLKTSVLYAVRDNTKNSTTGEIKELTEGDKASLCAEFEQAVTDVLISKTKRALEISGANTLIIGGGVSANTYIKESFKKMIENEFTFENDEQNVTLLIPQKNLSTDNSLMIGIAGFLQYSKGHFIAKLDKDHLDWNQTEFPELRANGNLGLE